MVMRTNYSSYVKQTSTVKKTMKIETMKKQELKIERANAKNNKSAKGTI
jgi:hypothetical protein